MSSGSMMTVGALRVRGQHPQSQSGYSQLPAFLIETMTL
jgi:hypothetical protein